MDIDIHSLNIDINQIESAITSKTRAVLAVSILGNPAKLEELATLCKKKNLLLIEDNCESLGAKIGEQYCGTFAEISTFSTFYSHQINTIEGGFILTNNSELSELVKSIRAHGWARELSPNSPLRPKESEAFPEAYQFLFPGYNARTNEIKCGCWNRSIGQVGPLISHTT